MNENFAFIKRKNVTIFACVLFSVGDKSAGQIRDSFPLPVLFNGMTISVIATDKHARIEYAIASAQKPINDNITRCGMPGMKSEKNVKNN